MFDYATLRVIWWVLLGTLIIGFAIMDGFDLGTAMLLPFLGRTDSERRIVINTVGPVWEGNQVWFILGGGAIFAAWPTLYAVSFSGFYLAMMVVLLTLILRPVAFKYRSKVPNKTWRSLWDWILTGCGFVTALVLGVAVGNVIQGVPFHFDEQLRPFYTGTFFQLLNPFALLTGVLSVAMMGMHGALYVATKTTDDVRKRGILYARLLAIIVITLFAIGRQWIPSIPGYEITSAVNPLGASNPTNKTVITTVGVWLNNFSTYPWMRIAPTIGMLGPIAVFLLAKLWHSRFAFLCSALTIFGIISTVGLSMFPFILPSSSTPSASLLVWDASSSPFTLGLMLFATVVFLPIIIAYTSWVYWVLRGKVTAKDIEVHQQTMY